MLCIRVRTSFVDFHRWPNAPEEVKYLRYLHRHEFKVEVMVRVANGHRQVEFHLFRDYIEKYTIPYLQSVLKEQANSLSCESMAEIFAQKLLSENFGVMTVVVSEDGENDGIWFLNPPKL